MEESPKYYAREHYNIWYNMRMKFVDRKDELSRLMRLANARAGGFAALWGRRRIGKSEILKEWCRRVGGIYTVADQSSAPVQREAFALVLSDKFHGFGDVVYPSWKALFDSLSQRAKAEGWHGPLVMDEFPYWVESDATLPSQLQNWIDREKSDGGIVSAIAGSVQHMMQGLVLDADSPLYGRVDEKMKLDPIGIEYLQDALGIDSAFDAVKSYSVWGGIPRYWVEAERFGDDVDSALDELVFSPLGVFHEEPTTLLQSEIPSAVGLKPYLDVIGLGANKVSEIAGRLGVAATAMSRPLSRLMEIGLVRREIPFGESEKNTKKSLYKVCDPFCRFWFSVMATRRSVFDSAPSAVRLGIWRKCRSHVFAAAWEDIARSSVVSSRRLLRLAAGGYWMPAMRWWQGLAPEWDVVSTDETGEEVLLGEAKWSDRPFSEDEVLSLVKAMKSRTPPPGLSGRLHYVLFLPSLKKPAKKVCEGVYILTAEDCICHT